MEKHLHIISFNVPFPADYGGVQDVYYKLVALHKAGVKITLHCFDYGRGPQSQLEQYCEKVYYYPRNNSFSKQFSYLPYIVSTRRSDTLLFNLLKDNYPIVFEGLHCCYLLSDKKLQHRLKLYRESNIEHHYYYHLFKAESSWMKKAYFLLEGLRLCGFQQRLRYAQQILAVSMTDADYLQHKFPNSETHYLPSFIPYDEIISIAGSGAYVLYHGNLSVAENHKAVTFLIETVFSKLPIPFKIAGSNVPQALKVLRNKYPHITLYENPSDEALLELITHAHINVLLTFQATGLKLKLLNALYAGRFCVVNDKMLVGTKLHDLCYQANTPEEIINSIKMLLNQPFRQADIEKRATQLAVMQYNNTANARQLIQWVYGGN